MRRPIFAANWKMNKTVPEALAFAESLLPRLGEADTLPDVVIAPPFVALERLRNALGGSPVALAAQNVSAEPEGAFTGEIAVRMLSDLGCRYTIVGHSERRALYAETSELVARKAVALQTAGIRPIVCVGESLEEREQGRTLDVVGDALAGSLAGVEAGDGEDLVIAYEPVWAIGTGKTATPEMAQEVHAFMREQLDKHYGGTAERIRIQYGGSVKPDNVRDLMAQTDIDGALIGGASLDPESFAGIIGFAGGSSR
jgi:triosephosphate isomerase